jgi:hypothetical protein
MSAALLLEFLALRDLAAKQEGLGPFAMAANLE